MKPTPKFLVAGGAVLGLAFAAYFGLPELAFRVSYAVQDAQAARAAEELLNVRELSTVFTKVAKAVKPSVVNISSVKIVKPGPELGQGSERSFGGPRDPFGDDLLDRFFRQRIPREGYKQTGIGTGVIVSPQGHVLTNNHVVAGADEVTVRIAPERDLPAKVVGTDPKTDLAVIKVEASDLRPAKLGNSDELEVGEWVLAMGNAFELSETLTAGIVSAKGRANMGIVDYEDFIQTDAAINPGNSGGPLINLRGEVVGINTAIFSRSGGSMGIGFAIPSNMARGVMESIIKEGKVVRGQLGVHIQNLNPGLAKSFGYQGTGGALVVEVQPDSPAAKVGLKEGDIIARFDGRPVKDTLELRNKVASLRPGSKVELEVFREGRTRNLQVEIGEQETEEPKRPAKEASLDLGMAVKTLTPELARQLDQSDELKGVVVVSVEPGGAADKAGIMPRDIVTAVQGQEVADVESFRRAVGKLDRKQGLRFKVRRGQANLYIFVPGPGGGQ